jgi:hypothetical protein
MSGMGGDNHSADGVLNSGGPLVALCKMAAAYMLTVGGYYVFKTAIRAIRVMWDDDQPSR